MGATQGNAHVRPDSPKVCLIPSSGNKEPPCRAETLEFVRLYLISTSASKPNHTSNQSQVGADYAGNLVTVHAPGPSSLRCKRVLQNLAAQPQTIIGLAGAVSQSWTVGPSYGNHTQAPCHLCSGRAAFETQQHHTSSVKVGRPAPLRLDTDTEHRARDGPTRPVRPVCHSGFRLATLLTQVWHAILSTPAGSTQPAQLGGCCSQLQQKLPGPDAPIRRQCWGCAQDPGRILQRPLACLQSSRSGPPPPL